MPDDLSLDVNFDMPDGNPPTWLADVAGMDSRWTRRTNPFGGGQLPQDAAPGPKTTYVLQIPIFISQPQPEQPETTAQAAPAPAEPAAQPGATARLAESTAEAAPAPESTAEAAAPVEAPALEGGGSEAAAGEGGAAPAAEGAEAAPAVETPAVESESLAPEEAPAVAPPAAEEAPAPEQPAAEQPETTEAPAPEEAQPGQAEEVPAAPLLNPPQAQYPALLEANWFAGLALVNTGSGTLPRFTFWDGYQEDGGLDFGYDETAGQDTTGAVAGMDVNTALFVSDFGCGTDLVGPGSYNASGHGTATIDLTKNNQNAVTEGMAPTSYKPNRAGNGPHAIPSRTGCAGIAVISQPASSAGDPVMPPTWWVMDSFTQGEVAGYLCAGTITAGATSLQFTAPGDLSVALIALRNLAGSIIPKQLLRWQGSVKDFTTKKQVDLSITPSLPYPWPPTQVPQQQVYAEPQSTLDKSHALAPRDSGPPFIIEALLPIEMDIRSGVMLEFLGQSSVDVPNSLGTITGVTVGGVSIPAGVEGGSSGWLQCDTALYAIIPPNTLPAGPFITCEVSNEAGSTTVQYPGGGGTSSPMQFATYDGIDAGGVAAWSDTDVLGDPHLSYSASYNAVSGGTYKGGAATMIAFIDFFTVAGAASDFPFIGGGWVKIWESGILSDLRIPGEPAFFHSQVWIYPNAPQSYLQGTVTWGNVHGPFSGFIPQAQIRIGLLNPCASLELLDENTSLGGALHVSASVGAQYLAYVTAPFASGRLWAGVVDTEGAFQTNTSLSGGTGAVGVGAVDYTVFSGLPETIGDITPVDLDGNPATSFYGAVWRITGPRNDIYPALGYTIWETCCGCFFQTLPHCGGTPAADWVGWLVGMQHADESDIRRVIWPQN